MSFGRHFALLVFLACLSQLIFTAESLKGAGRKEKKQDSRGDNNFAVVKGKFRTKDKAQCSWVARGEDRYTLSVTCKPGKGDEFTCKYTARPASCPGFVAEPETYWAQITRSLRKQKKLCSDPRSMLRSGMCKSAPQEAHFKLTETAHEKSPTKEKTPLREKEVTTNATTPETTRKCAQHSDHSKSAKEKCGDSWASLCTFFFTLVQNGDC
ncbi:Fibroblast growth factor-binding protein 1 [Triplophysa tibetana]|uniref:Fibroblast growth factor-binding protein 1 n=1 Tax=Triplophysa tibetana TaxID=1572043 RepID=A0A5A9PJS5_9TELE|nr:Fibroblast growth factor-binding protein 1 [Triplophysa tibetana]